MIAARKNFLFNFVLRRWLSFVLRRRFHNIYLLGAENLETLDMARPVVGCVNHTNWWDGFVLYVLSHRRFPHEIFLAMEEKNLRRYPFFTWMGVFGLDLSNPRAVLPGLRYGLGMLRAAGQKPRLVWIFVQGRLLDPRRPIEVKPGARFLATRANAQILPLILRYEWMLESRPSIFVHVGQPMPADTAPDALAAVLNQLFKSAAPENAALAEPLFSPRMSMNKCWDYFLHLLSRRRGMFDTQNH